jgi:hypothetical protein
MGADLGLVRFIAGVCLLAGAAWNTLGLLCVWPMQTMRILRIQGVSGSGRPYRSATSSEPERRAPLLSRSDVPFGAGPQRGIRLSVRSGDRGIIDGWQCPQIGTCLPALAVVSSRSRGTSSCHELSKSCTASMRQQSPDQRSYRSTT